MWHISKFICDSYFRKLLKVKILEKYERACNQLEKYCTRKAKENSWVTKDGAIFMDCKGGQQVCMDSKGN